MLTKTKSCTLYIGCTGSDGTQRDPEVVILAAAEMLASQGIEGATFTIADGMWKGEREKCVQVETIGGYFPRRTAVQALARALDQKCILVKIVGCDIDFTEA